MSSTLDPDDAGQGSPGGQSPAKSHSTGALGPSDSSDSGSDVAGAKRHEFDVDSELDNHALGSGAQEQDSDTDRSGTGERASADGDANLDPDGDIEPRRVDDLLQDEDGTMQGD